MYNKINLAKHPDCMLLSLLLYHTVIERLTSAPWEEELYSAHHSLFLQLPFLSPHIQLKKGFVPLVAGTVFPGVTVWQGYNPLQSCPAERGSAGQSTWVSSFSWKRESFPHLPARRKTRKAFPPEPAATAPAWSQRSLPAFKALLRELIVLPEQFNALPIQASDGTLSWCEAAAQWLQRYCTGGYSWEFTELILYGKISISSASQHSVNW